MIQLCIAVLLPFLPVLAAAKPPAPGREAQKNFDAAVLLYEKADFDGALKRFNKAIALFDGWKTASAHRAMCRWTMGDKAGAEEDARLGAQLKPNSPESFVGRAKSRFVLKDYDGSLNDYDEALKLDPDNAEAHFGIGSVLSAKGDPAKALRSLDNAVRLNSQFAAALLVRGAARERLKDFPRAVRDFTRVLEINPKFLWAHFFRGKSYREVKDYRKAIDDFDEFIEAHPDFEEAVYLRSNVRFLMGDYSGAESDLSRVIELNPKRGLAYSNRGQARAQLGDNAGALSDLRKAIELEPGKKDKIQGAIDRLSSGEAAAAAPRESRTAPLPSGQGEQPLSGDGAAPAAPLPVTEPPQRASGLERLEDMPATVTIEGREVRGRAKRAPLAEEELPEPGAAVDQGARESAAPQRGSVPQRAEDEPTVTIEDRSVRSRAKPPVIIEEDLPEPSPAGKADPASAPAGRQPSRPGTPAPEPVQSTGLEEAVLIE